ncbi:MAG: hypothetical protein ACLT1W_14860 [Alistipes onderdonkii]
MNRIEPPVCLDAGHSVHVQSLLLEASPVAQGEMNIHLAADTELESFTAARSFGDPSVCYPVTRITYQGYTKEYKIK